MQDGGQEPVGQGEAGRRPVPGAACRGRWPRRLSRLASRWWSCRVIRAAIRASHPAAGHPGQRGDGRARPGRGWAGRGIGVAAGWPCPRGRVASPVAVLTRVKGVVPVAVPVVAGQRQGVHLRVADLDAGPGSCRCRVRRAPAARCRWWSRRWSATMTSWLVSGRPRQFMVMWENSRCSILFHFEVPGGKWQTVISSPVSSGEGGQLGLPRPGPVAVGPAGVRGDQQPPACG